LGAFVAAGDGAQQGGGVVAGARRATWTPGDFGMLVIAPPAILW
jgi:hypothetical protein